MKSKRKPVRLALVVCLLSYWVLSSAPALCVAFAPDQHPSNAGSTGADGEAAGQQDAFQRALILLQKNRLGDALDELTTAEGEHPGDARVRGFRAVVLARLGRTTEASSEYREALRIDPRNADVWKNLGFMEWTEHHLDEARHSLESAVQLAPDDGFAHYYLGRVELEAQRYEQAFRELKRSNVPLPTDAEFLLAVATGYLVLGQQEDALRTLDRLSAMPLSLAQTSNAAALLARAHEPAKALQLLHTAAGPVLVDRPWIRFNAALIYLWAGNYKAAIEEALPLTGTPGASSSANADSTEAAAAWSLIGIAYAREGGADAAVHAVHAVHAVRAVEALRRASALAPLQEEHWLNLTRELMEVSRYAEAVSSTQAALVANPKSYALHLRLGAANLSAGRYADAEAAFRELVSAGDPLPTSYVGLAQVLLRTGRAEEAAAELAVAREKLGPDFLICYFQGLSLSRANQRLSAVPAFEEALRLNPGSAEAHLGLGQTDFALGRVSDAIAQFEETLRLSPGDKQAQRLLKQAYYRSGDKKTALAAETTENAAVEEKSNLLGDFVVPQWQSPAEPAVRSSDVLEPRAAEK